MKKTFAALCFIACMLSFPAFYKGMTHGFRPGKLKRKFCLSLQEASSTSNAPMPAEIARLFHRPFRYIGRGLQSFAFQSEDGQIVVKLFKKIGPSRGIKSIRQKKDSIAPGEKMANTFQACEIAFAMAKKETGVLYLSLEPTSERQPLLLIKNRFGFLSQIALDRYAFVIQRKAEPFEPVLLRALKDGSAGALIDSYLELMYHRAQKGICNTDLSFKNLGFLEGGAIEIDFGNYVYRPEEKQLEWNRWVSEMRYFLKANHPEFLSEYERKVKDFS